MSRVELTSCLVADLVPHGMLPLAWAASAGTGSAAAVAMMLLFGSLSSYSLVLCALVAESSKEKKESSALSSVWTSAGLPVPVLVDTTVALVCFGCCVFYAAFAGDLFHALTRRIVKQRWIVVAALFATPLAPLCLGDDLSVLKYSSYAGLLGIFYTVLYLVTLGGGGGGAAGSNPLPEAAEAWSMLRINGAPIKPPMSPWRISSGTAVLLNTLVVAYLCHYNALQYYHELRATTLRRYAGVAVSAALVTTAAFAGAMIGGRAAFGSAAKPNILNNLPASTGAVLARLGTGIAILSGFPLMFAGLKSAIEGILGKGDEEESHKPLYSVCLCAIASIAIAANEEQIGFVIEIIGSTLGCMVCYVIPGIAAACSATIPKIHRSLGAVLAAAGSFLSVGTTYHTLVHM